MQSCDYECTRNGTQGEVSPSSSYGGESARLSERAFA